MEEVLYQLGIFYNTYGVILTVIAVVGIIVLGILKYCNVFKKIENETVRHLLYIVISVAISAIGALIYLLCISQFDWVAYLVFIGVVWGLNQTAYNVFKVTHINDLFTKLLDLIKNLFVKKETTDTSNNQVEDEVVETKSEETSK